MIFEQIACGGDRNYAYIIGDEASGEGVLVDPAFGVDLILQQASSLGLSISIIFNTHAHGDHNGGNEEAAAKTGAKIAVHSSADYGDIPLEHNQIITVGALELEIIHTPGHTPDSICIRVGKNVCTGDTLFVGKVGGTWSEEAAAQEYDSLHNRLMTLPDDTIVYPGHNYGVMPQSTIGQEKETNPFLLQPDYEAFVRLKDNWAQYKQEHGIA